MWRFVQPVCAQCNKHKNYYAAIYRYIQYIEVFDASIQLPSRLAAEIGRNYQNVTEASVLLATFFHSQRQFLSNTSGLLQPATDAEDITNIKQKRRYEMQLIFVHIIRLGHIQHALTASHTFGMFSLKIHPSLPVMLI